MAAQDFRSCPDCGSRNKVKWDYCARCGRSMQDVAVGAATSSEDDAEGAALSPRTSVWSILGAVVLLAVGIAVWRSGWRLSVSQPDPAALSLGVVPSAAPPATSAPGSPTAALFARAMSLAAAGDMGSAVPLFDEVLRDEPRSAQYRAGYGGALWSAGRRDLALAQLRAAADIEPAPNRLVLARRLQEAGQTQESIKEYEAVLAANPKEAGVAGEFGTVLSDAGQYARAVEVFRIATAGSANSNARAALAFALEKTGDNRSAVDVYRQLLNENGGLTLVRARLADLMVKGGDSQGAAKLCEEGLKLTPDAPFLHTGLGRAYDEMGKWKEAAAEYRESVRLAPNAESAKALTARADALEKLGQGGS